MRTARQLTLLAAICVPSLARAQAGPDVDPELARLIAAAPAIDNHAHPVLPPPNLATDRGFDALPVDNMEPQTDPVGWRPDNLQLIDAWKALWHFNEAPPLSADAMKRLSASRDKVRAQQGEHYDQWVLDQAHIGTMLANRVACWRWFPRSDDSCHPTAGR